MAFKTLSGYDNTQTGPNGIPSYTAGNTLAASDLNNVLADGQQWEAQSALAGVLAGGVCTASALVVSVPVDTLVFAKQLWLVVTAAVTVSVPDSATTYLWFCADGVIRQTATLVLPMGWDARSCALLTKATAAAGAATVDNTVQWKARVSDATNRTVTDGPLVIDYANQRVDVSAGAFRIPVLTSDPASPVSGDIWLRSDTNSLRVRIGSTTYNTAL